MSWAFVIFGLACIAFGTWAVLNPAQVADAVQSAQSRGKNDPRGQDEPQMPYRNELGIWLQPGDRARSMRWVGIIAMAIGLGMAAAAIAGLAS